MIANQLTDIFTEEDDSIFSDGSIDPLGLRVIWTSIGNKIFGNKLNTISTDIRFFTLNLFHHSIVEECERKYEEQFAKLCGTPPYNNNVDLEDGLIIFLESLMTHSMNEVWESMRELEMGMVPGMSKLRNKKDSHPTDKMVTEIEVNRAKGILVRHHLLGIHGRHKNPFREMDIFVGNNYYLHKELWKDAGQIFSISPWKELREKLITLIGSKVLVSKRVSGSYLKIKVNELPVKELSDLYFACLQPKIFKNKTLVNFWEARLGLLEGTANVLYSELKNAAVHLEEGEWPDLPGIIKSAAIMETDVNSKNIHAINAIEPLLTCFDKVTNRILFRRTSTVNELIPFADKWLSGVTINVKSVEPFLNEVYMERSALGRLKELINIYTNSTTGYMFIEKIINYHKKIMENRGGMPWVSLSKTGEIKHNRSYNFSNDYLEFLSTDVWVNNYYLSTVFKLYKGLHN